MSKTMRLDENIFEMGKTIALYSGVSVAMGYHRYDGFGFRVTYTHGIDYLEVERVQIKLTDGTLVFDASFQTVDRIRRGIFGKSYDRGREFIIAVCRPGFWIGLFGQIYDGVKKCKHEQDFKNGEIAPFDPISDVQIFESAKKAKK